MKKLIATYPFKLFIMFFMVGSVASCGGGSSSDSNATSPADPATDTDTVTVTDKTSPATFDLVAANTIEPTTLTVDWKPTVDDTTAQKEIKYVLHVSTSAGFTPSPATANTSTTGKTTALATGLDAGTTYYVRVVSMDKAGNTSWSNQLEAKTTDSAPVPLNTPVITPKNIQSISATEIIYNAKNPPAAGTILVGQEGQGYLRKVTGATISNGVVTAQLAPASLNELFSDISISSRIRLVSTSVASDSSSAAKQGTNTGIKALRTNNDTRELKWKSGLVLSEKRIPYKPPTKGSGTKSWVSVIRKAGSVSGSIQTTQQGNDSFSGPAVFAGEPGEQYTFELKATINNTNYELCKITLTGFDAGVSSRPAVSAVNTSTGTATVTWSPTNADVKDTPYYGEFTAFVDAKGDNCNGDDQWLSRWSEKIKLEVPIYVVKGKPASLNNETKSLSFTGGFTASDQLSMNFDPEFNISANIRFGKLQTADLIINTNIDLKNEITINANGSSTLDKTVPILKERTFTKIFMAGSVPVIVKGKFKIDGRITGNAYGNVTLKKVIGLQFPDARFGLRYDQNGWQAVKNFQAKYQFSLDGQGDAGADIKLAIIPDMQISFYDAASGRLIVEPYLYANTKIHGQLVYMNSTDGTGTDKSYWFDDLVAGAGVDLKLWSGLSILDYNIASYPAGTSINEPDRFKQLAALAQTPLWGLPVLTVTRLPTVPTPDGTADSRTIMFEGDATDIANPFSGIFGPESYNPFRNWEQAEVLKQVNGLYVSTDTASIKTEALGQYQLVYTQPGSYEVRLAGYSDAGKYFRQVTSRTVEITDNDANGMADQWESLWGISDPNADPDGDGMTNIQEYQGGYFPLIADNPDSADTTPPVITLNGNNPETIQLNTTYTDAGATATDNIDGPVPVTSTGTVNPATEGSYTITYKATDAAGNTAIATRMVNVIPANTDTTATRPLNDTGITWGGNYTSGNNTTCIGETIAEQDCSYGRDAQAAAGTLAKTGGGDAGFDFTKLDASGQPLADQTQNYATRPWACVRDNHTGLVWEVKTPAGSGSIHDAGNSYRWGGKTAQIKAGQTYGTLYNDWDTLVDDTNSGSGLCGFTDWRVPTFEELSTIVNLGKSNPAIDTNYFPNTVGLFWSSSPRSLYSNRAWGIHFNDGLTYRDLRENLGQVRLVRNGQ